VRCAIEVRSGMVERNAGVSPEKRIEFRVGIHLGDVVEEADGDLMGDGVNIASRLEGVAEPNGICVSRAAYEQVRDKLQHKFFDLGEKQLKNIVRPVHAYRVTMDRNPTNSESVAPENPTSRLSLPDKPSIAVLPFQNISGDPEQEYFADGIVEDIITGLSRTKSLFVIARNSSFTYKGRSFDVGQVGRELGVRYVLEGSVRKAAARLRITCQLIDTTSDRHIWADRFDGASRRLRAPRWNVREPSPRLRSPPMIAFSERLPRFASPRSPVSKKALRFAVRRSRSIRTMLRPMASRPGVACSDWLMAGRRKETTRPALSSRVMPSRLAATIPPRSARRRWRSGCYQGT
jgi:TolB-like protein